MNGLSADGDRGQRALHDVSFDLHAGEIVAVCGVAGNGQRELAEAICATRPRASAAAVLVGGRATTGDDPRQLIEAGVAHIPEDRLHVGLAASASIEDNLVLKSYRKPPISSGPFIRRVASARQRHDVDRALRCPRSVAGGTDTRAVGWQRAEGAARPRAER